MEQSRTLLMQLFLGLSWLLQELSANVLLVCAAAFCLISVLTVAEQIVVPQDC